MASAASQRLDGPGRSSAKGDALCEQMVQRFVFSFAWLVGFLRAQSARDAFV